MPWPVIILDGPLRNQTLSGIQFDKHGEVTKQEVFVCDNWTDGILWAKQHGHESALFVKSGTMFTDWHQWTKLVDAYPHYGLIAHLIWHPGKQVCLDDQCWFMDLDKFAAEDFAISTVCHPVPVRSDQNLHDDYTPVWIKPGSTVTEYITTSPGQGLIAKQLQSNRAVVNWNNAARDLKFFSYDGTVNLLKFQDYKNIAENQLWIFNNEPITIVKQQQLVSPGSGLSWILNVIDAATQHLQIVDISRVQLDFCQQLWTTWNGSDYGNFVWNFITQNKLKHYEVDNPNITPLERLQLKKQSIFVEYVNSRFTKQVEKNFVNCWQQAQKTKVVEFCNDNLVEWVLKNNVSAYDNIWCSNILNYKWTLLHTTVEQYNNFQSKINET
jgi:hypothetical protein